MGNICPRIFGSLRWCYEAIVGILSFCFRQNSFKSSRQRTSNKSYGTYDAGERQNAQFQKACLITSSNASSAENGFREEFKALMEIQSNGIIESSQAIPDMPVFVICNNATRILEDLKACLVDIESSHYSKLCVIVLHVCRQDSLHKQDKLLTQSPYRSVNKIIDMAYTVHDGIYKCDMNDDASKELHDFLSGNSIDD